MKKNTLQFICGLCSLLLYPLLAEANHLKDSHESFCNAGSHRDTLEIIKQMDARYVGAVIESEIPELTIRSIEIITLGWDNLVADVNEEWIFRFPRREELLPLFEREQWLLTCMRHSVMMPVPHYQYAGKGIAFVGYRKIPGEALTSEKYLNLSDLEREKVAEALALFLSQMHGTINVQEARERGYEDYKTPLGWIENSLLGTLSSQVERMIGETLEVAKHFFFAADQMVLLHNDLHGGNMAFNMERKQITGVFDLSDAKIGNYAIDFGQLFMIHPDLAVRTAEAYAAFRGVESPVIAAAATYVLRRGCGILRFREQSLKSRELRLTKQLEEFVPIWDALQKK